MRRNANSHLRKPSAQIVILLALIACLGTLTWGQQTQYDKGTPPQFAAGVSSFGSYNSVELGTVNLSNGSLNLKLPLGSVGGRGFSIPITLNYSSKVWSAGRDSDFDIQEDCRQGDRGCPHSLPVVYANFAQADYSMDFYNRVAPGWTIGAQPLLKKAYMGVSPPQGADCGSPYSLTKLTLVLPDKGEVQFRDDLTDGAPLRSVDSGGCFNSDGYRGSRWHSTDGSGAVYISDHPDGVARGFLAGVVITSDGTRYHFVDAPAGSLSSEAPEGLGVARCDSIVDRHGNTIRIVASSNGVVYTDQLGRLSSITWGEEGLLITLPGYNEQTRQYKVKLGVMNRHYRSDLNVVKPVFTGAFDDEMGSHHYRDKLPSGPYTELFPHSWGKNLEQIDGLNVVSSVELPDGQQLKFAYNAYGEVAEVEMPTGGKVQYEYAATGNMPSGNSLPREVQTAGRLASEVRDIDRALSARRVLSDGANVDATWRYVYGPLEAPGGSTHPGTTVTARAGTSEAGELLSDEGHLFLRAQRYVDSFNLTGTDYRLWTTGIEWRTETRDAAGKIITASEKDWARRTPAAWKNTDYLPQEEIENDNRVSQERKVLDDGKVSKTTTEYDEFSNPTIVREYDFDGTLKRRTVTSYLATNSEVNSVNYLDDATHLLRLPTQTSIFLNESDSSEQVRTVYEYDRYVVDNKRGRLEYYSPDVITGHDSDKYGPARSARGNVTQIGRWLKSEDRCIYIYPRYDVVGNVVSMKDARGFESFTGFRDDFGDGTNPGGSISGKNGQTFALPTRFTSPPPNPGDAPHIAQAQYDFSTGLLTGFRDRNGVVVQTTYNDPFNRPTLVKSALGTELENHTAMFYAPSSAHGITLTRNDVLTAKDLGNVDDAKIRSWTQTDGFGRGVEAWSHMPADASGRSGDVVVKTEYDKLGRPRAVSNPFRPAWDEKAQFTTTVYDLAGRVKSVTTPDGAAVSTSYVGNQTTVKDQAGKVGLSVSDALGRLTEVVEAPDTLKFSTTYSYDIQNNLEKVTQGVQTRKFVYDSLSRLVSTDNPENGITSYAYDDGNNLTVKTDSLSRTIRHEYDALNRLKLKDYSDATPDVTYVYDTGYMDAQGKFQPVANAMGRLVEVRNSVSTTTNTAYNVLGGIAASMQTTIVPGASSESIPQSYISNYEYNLVGALVKQTLPSGRVVENKFDDAGRINEVLQRLNNVGETRSYAANLSYAAHGALDGIKLGNGLWEQTRFNVRLQVGEIRLGTTAGGVDKLHLGYDYGVTVNNGNMRAQTINAPAIGNIPAFTATQTYEYDDLNRLKKFSETTGLTQVFDYDRYGNRTLGAGTTFPALPPDGIDRFNNPKISQTTNRIEDNQGYGYDKVGNLTRDAAGKLYGYDADNLQVTINGGMYPGGVSSNGAASYYYDGAGRRVKKVTAGGTTVFVYDAAGQMVAEYTDASRQGAGGTSYLTTDTLGSPRVVTDNRGSAIARHDYLAFGEELSIGRGQVSAYGAGALRQQFTGQERDSESGLDFFKARYYSSAHGRFTGVDPLATSARPPNPQTWNRYAYVINNPMRFIDPTGMSSEDATTSTPDKQKEQTAAEARKQLQAYLDAHAEADTKDINLYNTGLHNHDKALYEAVSNAVQGAAIDIDATGKKHVVSTIGETIKSFIGLGVAAGDPAKESGEVGGGIKNHVGQIMETRKTLIDIDSAAAKAIVVAYNAWVAKMPVLDPEVHARESMRAELEGRPSRINITDTATAEGVLPLVNRVNAKVEALGVKRK
jgi:RHS repeat-associated protein